VDKPLVGLHGEVKTPTFSAEARLRGWESVPPTAAWAALGLPHSRPMSSIGPRCHELRIQDAHVTWRMVYRLDADAVIIAEVFSKKTRATPKAVLDVCKRRLAAYDRAAREENA
jgi:hypothetical protein